MDDLDTVTVLVMVAEVEIGDAKVIGTTTRCVIRRPTRAPDHSGTLGHFGGGRRTRVAGRVEHRRVPQVVVSRSRRPDGAGDDS